METRIRVTEKQEDLLRWALDPMADYAKCPDSDFNSNDLPEWDGRVLVVRNTENRINMLKDLLYRLEVQSEDIAASHPWSEVCGDVRAARNAAEKIRENFQW